MPSHFPINILIVEQNELNLKALTSILRDDTNNFIHAQSPYGALSILRRLKIAIILLNIDHPRMDGFEFLETLRENDSTKNIYTIIYSDNEVSSSRLVKGLQEGAVDYFQKPFNPNVIKAKFAVFKTLYFKDRKIDELLSNILPKDVLKEVKNTGEYHPKKNNNAVVLFTDFVQFSVSSKELKPMDLLKELERYFTFFDSVMDRFQLEKIKTIGDAYMAIAGVNDDLPHPEIRASLAALEIRNFVIQDNLQADVKGKSYFKIRIGIHAGPLVSGIIGSKKMSFDVWGDTVNIASRAEHSCSPNNITVTESIKKKIDDYFEITHLGEKEIVKRGGVFELFTIDQLKEQHSLFSTGHAPNPELRRMIGLTPMDFDIARKAIIEQLKNELPDDLYYHSLNHTINVENSAILFADLEGVSGVELILLRTAVLFHDSGYMLQPENNEDYAIQLARELLPNYGYSPSEILRISELIEATKHNVEPRTLLEEIICDADHDYFGRNDYYDIAAKLRLELVYQGRKMDEEEWIRFQLNYLENEHKYYTNSAKNIRLRGKQLRIEELKSILQKY
jgi:adenylate cyclase